MEKRLNTINKYKNRKDLGLSIHINLVEGRPISNPNELNLIVSKKGILIGHLLDYG